MIPLEEAQALVHRHCRRLPSETIDVHDAPGRVLAADVRARAPMPRFDASAVDGYAMAQARTERASAVNPVSFAVVATARAGDRLHIRAGGQRAIRILTGAPMPAGADTVVMQEEVKQANGDIIISREVRKGENVRRKGEEFGRGDCVLTAGTLVTPPVQGLLAGLGLTRIRVVRRPRVSLLVTGSELREPGTRLAHGQIYDSNSATIVSALGALGIVPEQVCRVADDLAALRSAFAAALRDADVLITVGGVSVGDYDFIREVAVRSNVRQVFWNVAIKPGKPNYFGKKGSKLVFGLPGNPVAALLSMQLFVRPAIAMLSGRQEHRELRFRATLESDVRKKAGRTELLRGVLSSGTDGELHAVPLSARDSHMLSGLAGANALIHLPVEGTCFEKGSKIDVTLLDWYPT